MEEVRAAFFDVGETRQWGLWADWLGVPRLTFFAALGAVIACGDHHRSVFDYFVPGLDIAKAEASRVLSGLTYSIERQDLYGDVLPCIAALRERGLIVGIAGNQPEACEAALQSCGIVVDHLASSARWKIEEPSQRFFRKIVEEIGLPAHQIAYVGDRLDNDILPAAEFGLAAIFIERGPWGVTHARNTEIGKASARIRSLSELSEIFSKSWKRSAASR